MAEVNFNFRGKKAIVTGASQGIGRDIVRALSEANCSKIYAIARDQSKLDELTKDFPRVETISVDLTDWDATRKLVEEIEPVDFLVNNAGGGLEDDITDLTQETFQKLTSLNVESVLNVSQIVCAKMKAKGCGSVVNMSSAVSLSYYKRLLSYSVSKYALDGATKHMAMELAPEVRVNSVHPTGVMTGRSRVYWSGERGDNKKKEIPMNRFAEVEEVTNATLFLLSNAAGMTTGHCFPADGGENI